MTKPKSEGTKQPPAKEDELSAKDELSIQSTNSKKITLIIPKEYQRKLAGSKLQRIPEGWEQVTGGKVHAGDMHLTLIYGSNGKRLVWDGPIGYGDITPISDHVAVIRKKKGYGPEPVDSFPDEMTALTNLMTKPVVTNENRLAAKSDAKEVNIPDGYERVFDGITLEGDMALHRNTKKQWVWKAIPEFENVSSWPVVIRKKGRSSDKFVNPQSDPNNPYFDKSTKTLDYDRGHGLRNHKPNKPDKPNKSIASTPQPQPQGAVCCPNCQSTQLTANQKGFGLKGAVVGGLLLGPVGLLGGFVGSKKLILTCLNCGWSGGPLAD